MQDDLKSLFAYNRWANDHVVEACRANAGAVSSRSPPPAGPRSAPRSFTWPTRPRSGARRIAGEPVTARADEADVPALDDAERLLARGHDAFDQLLATLPPERLASAWTYRNLEGRDLTLPLWAVFRHVVNHATYHRGQIASKLGRLGATPPRTDLVVWAIEQSRR